LAKKYYVGWQGRQTGIFNSWDQCQAQVVKFADAKFKSFPTLAEAEAAFGDNKSLKLNSSNAA
jgi:ribonuclease HI